ncbi:ABC transporter permease [Shewanella halifaxensis]|uniref:ABC transporter permease n=1 Tax=Shewanella halifaxensis TaxID=271098 RepID=UPI000D5963D1|nr:ABC transporter permease [Shewanella halifaxensis]
MAINNDIALIHVMAIMKLKSQSTKLILSYFWWVLEPLFHVLTFYLVFNFLLGRGEGDFFTFLMVGQIPFLWFQKSVLSASTSLGQNLGLIMTKAMPKYIFPTVNIQEATYKQLFVFAILFMFLSTSGSLLEVNWLDFILLCLVQYIFMLGIGWIFSILVAYAPDFSMLIPVFMMGLMFSSGIFWDVNSLPEGVIKELVFTINPMVPLLDAYRTVLMHKTELDYEGLAPVIILGITFCMIAMCVFKFCNASLTRRLMA